MTARVPVAAMTWRPGSGAGFQWRPVAGGVLLTALIFLLLPVLERLSRPPTDARRLLEVETRPPLPAPLPEPPRPEPVRPAETLRELPRPRAPAVHDRALPLSAVLDIDLGLQPVETDVDLSFSVVSADRLGSMGDLVFEISDLDRPPQAIVRLSPMYPPHARMRGQEGAVTLEFVVGRDGTTRDIRVIDAEPLDVFTHSAVSAVKRWRFEPGRRDGRDVAVRVQQTITFNLE